MEKACVFLHLRCIIAQIKPLWEKFMFEGKEEYMEQQHLFTNKMLRVLLVPIILEQLLNALMGTVDTMMVSNVGSAAISAVSLVDSINVLIIQAFSALAAGGTIICTQYLGQKNHEMANKSARQALFIITAISIGIVILGVVFRDRCFDLFLEMWIRM